MIGGNCRCSPIFVPDWESSVITVIANDETDAQGRVPRCRIFKWLSLALCLPLTLSPSSFCFVPCVLVQGKQCQLPLQCHQLSFTLTAVHMSCFCHGSLCLHLGLLLDWSGQRADTMVRDPNREVAPIEALWKGDSETKEVPFSI